MIFNYIFGTIYLIIPILGTVIFPVQKDYIIATHELISEGIFAILILRSFAQREITLGRSKWLFTSLLALFVADSLYSAGIIRGNGLPELLGSISEFAYTVFMSSMLLFLIKRKNVVLEDPIAKVIWTCCFLGHFWLSYKFILHSFYNRESTPSLFNLVNSTAYAIASSLVFAYLIPYVLRITKRSEYWFLQALLLLLISDFAIRYQSAFVSESMFSIAESGWAVAVGILMLTLLSNFRRIDNFFTEAFLPGIISVRVMLSLAISWANLLLLAGVVIINIYMIRNAFHLTNALFLIYVIWVISNSLAIRVSEALLEVRTLMRLSSESANGQRNLQMLSTIDKRLSLSEVDQLIYGYNDLVSRTNSLISELISKERMAAMAHVAAQVAHDIRSPLAALGAIEKDLVQVPENTRLIVRQAVGRIRDIANNLIEQHTKNPNRKEHTKTESQGNNQNELSHLDNSAIDLAPACIENHLLSLLIDGLITEKRLQYRDRSSIEIIFTQELAGYGLFAKVEVTEFKRALSNIINNAVEAISEQGQVLVRVHAKGAQVFIDVTDNGCGIPSGLISRLGQRGETHGKTTGLGLGLFQAKTALERWGGALSILSIQQPSSNHGTTVQLVIPKATAPDWFLEKLLIRKNGIIVSLDDDLSIHQVWKKRFESALVFEHGAQLKQFTSPHELKNWVLASALEVEHTIFLLDYELLGFQESGLDLVENLGLHQQSILVSSRYDDPDIMMRARKLRIRILPKPVAAFVPIELG